jgi:uracil-DNA glycosylase
MSTAIIGNRMVFPMYHPSFILRNESYKDGYKAAFENIAATIKHIQSNNAAEIATTFYKNKQIPF